MRVKRGRVVYMRHSTSFDAALLRWCLKACIESIVTKEEEEEEEGSTIWLVLDGGGTNWSLSSSSCVYCVLTRTVEDV